MITSLRSTAGFKFFTRGLAIVLLFLSAENNSFSRQARQTISFNDDTVFEAPLQMLADAPTDYMKEQESTDFVGAMSNWDQRDITN